MNSKNIRSLVEKIKNNRPYVGTELVEAVSLSNVSERFNDFQFLGRMYYEYGDAEKAVVYLDRALMILNTVNPFEFSDISRGDFYQHYIGINKALHNPKNLIKANKLFAKYYCEKSQFGLAVECLNKARNAYVDCGYGDRYEYDTEILDMLNEISNTLFALYHLDQNQGTGRTYTGKNQVSIAYIVSGANYPNSAMVRVMVEIAKYTDKSKFKVIFFIVENDFLTENISALKETGAAVILPNDGKFSKLRFALASGKLILEFNPDLVVVTSILANYEQYIILKWLKSKHLIGLCFGPPAQYLPLILDWCISPSYHNLLEATCGGTLVPLEINSEKIKPTLRQVAEELKRKYCQNPENIFMVSAGRAIKFKNNEFWQEIIDLLEKSRKLIFILVGVQSLSEVYQGKIDEKITKRIYCIEWTDLYINYIELADIYVDTYPSGGGFTVIDAMSKGKPVVTFQENFDTPFSQIDWSPGSEYLDIPELIAPRGDYDVWKKIIIKLVNDEQYRISLGKKSYNKYLNNHSKPNRMVANYEKVYLEVLKSHKPIQVFSEKQEKLLLDVIRLSLLTFSLDQNSPLYENFSELKYKALNNQILLSNVNIYTKRKIFYEYVLPKIKFLDKIFSLQNFFGIFLIRKKDYLLKDVIFIEDLEKTDLSLFTIYSLSKQKKIFLLVKNYWMWTGHCIYPVNCDKWKMHCHQCPNLQISIPLKFDTTRFLFQLKLSIISRSNVEIIVESEEIKRILKQSPIVQRKKIHVVEPGINLNFSQNRDAVSLKNKLNIPSEALVFGIMGENKLIEDNKIEKIFSDLPINESIYLVTIDADYFIKISNIIHININSSDNIYNENDIILLCNVWLIHEFFLGISNFILKAMASKKLIISVNLVGVSSLLKHPDGGIVVPSNKFIDMKSAVEYLLHHKNEIFDYGIAASEIVYDFYNEDTFRSSIAQLVEDNLK